MVKPSEHQQPGSSYEEEKKDHAYGKILCRSSSVSDQSWKEVHYREPRDISHMANQGIPYAINEKWSYLECHRYVQAWHEGSLHEVTIQEGYMSYAQFS